MFERAACHTEAIIARALEFIRRGLHGVVRSPAFDHENSTGNRMIWSQERMERKHTSNANEHQDYYQQERTAPGWQPHLPPPKTAKHGPRLSLWPFLSGGFGRHSARAYLSRRVGLLRIPGSHAQRLAK